MYRTVPCIKGSGDTYAPSTHDVVLEVPISVMVNGRQVLTSMMSPHDIRDFVVGYLFTEGIIRRLDEIESIRIEENTASVLTKNLFKILGTKKIILSGCGGSSSFLDVAKLPKIASDLTIRREDIQDGMKTVLSSSLHALTGGFHVVGLLNHQGVITIAEDIGRHNALDRVIGRGLLEGIAFGETFVVSSGRISSEMVRKCLVANIPVVVSRGATTSLAIEVASKTGLTVIGFARGEKMNIYTGAGRVSGSPSVPL